MIKVGLSGNRFSGVDTVSKLFEEIDVPVFYADNILKFIINQDYLMLDRVKDRVGTHVFLSGHVESSRVNTRTDFDKIIDCAEFSLMKAYDKFNQKNKSAIYTIFQSSILIERGWNVSNMNHSINVFCPKNTRIRNSGLDGSKATCMLMNEIEDSTKNLLADYTIHNYSDCNLKLQVGEFDRKMIDKFINKDMPISFINTVAINTKPNRLEIGHRTF